MVKGETVEMDALSTRTDGRASIEHQIDFHVLDLAEALSGTARDVTLGEVLHGLRYVVEHRLRGQRMAHLEPGLMRRLGEGLLGAMGFGGRRVSTEADMAFFLFGDFVVEVAEFRSAVGELSPTDLTRGLRIWRRLQLAQSAPESCAVLAVLTALTSRFPQFADWRELVRGDEVAKVAAAAASAGVSLGSASGTVSGTGPGSLLGSLPGSLPGTPAIVYPPQMLWFDKDVTRVLQMYNVDPEKGLSKDRIPPLLAHYGFNKLPEPPKPSVLLMLWTQITDFMVVILIIATIVTASTNEEKSAVTLAVVIVLNVIIGFTQEFKANKALSALMNLTVAKAKVVRDSTVREIPADDLVPGDVVILDEGDAIPADLRLIEVSSLQVIESILTGESLAVSKDIERRRVRTRKLPLGDCKANTFMSTVVARGRAKGIVVRTGDKTEIGKISKALTSTKTQRTPIEKQLATLGKWLVFLSILLCVIIVIIGIAYKRQASEMVKIGLTLAVSVIPEGLVAVVTVAMAIGVQRMAAHNAIVRRLPCVETLGSVTYICSDKTGTLTEGKMGTAQLWTSDKTTYNFTSCTALDASIGQVMLATKSSEEPLPNPGSRFKVSMMILGLCNNATIGIEKDGQFRPTGDPTEVALVSATQRAKLSKETFLSDYSLKKLGEFPFDSERKLMSVVYEGGSLIPGKAIVVAKGAPEALLNKCNAFFPYGDDVSLEKLLVGHSQPMSEEFEDYVEDKAEEMANGGLRVLGQAVRILEISDVKDMLAKEDASLAECQLTFVSLAGLMDPPKAGVRESVEMCRNAGINVVMITGDHINTASAIAKQISIMDEHDPTRSRAMKGTELDMLSQEQLIGLNPFPVVFARVSPDNKLQIVTALQARGELAAMTGDGVNDAPAIKKSNVGIAMGIGGTEITKQAADIVLADDNFTTIVEAVKEGRRVFDNIQKFIVYLLSCNCAEIILMLICSLVNLDIPFEPIMILWANIIADIPPAMSLGVEPAEPNLMARKPRDPRSGVLPLRPSVILVAQALIMSLSSLVVYVLIVETQAFPSLNDASNVNKRRLQETTTFLVLTSQQLVQSFWSRSVTESAFKIGVIGNPWMILAFVVSAGSMMLGFYVKPIADALEFVPPLGVSYAITAVCLVVQFVLLEVVKLGVRHWSGEFPWTKTKKPTTAYSAVGNPAFVGSVV